MTVYHMASMGRCGETMLLRCLNAHPAIIAVGDGFMKSDHSELLALEADERTFVVKQTWEETGAWRGFVLIRNPLAVYRSLCDFRGNGSGVTNRLGRWAAKMYPPFQPEGDEVEQFCQFYVYRFRSLLMAGPGERRCVVRYEDLVAQPMMQLLYLCALLNVEFNPAVLTSHLNYAPGEVIHERTRGDRPIDTSSLDRWRELPAESIHRIVKATRDTCAAYCYDLDSLTKGMQ